uniref:Uncharacterized protein n=1 Tax=Ananas comosus var. bracteatus TaxID=296719 RepID=A0A6V7Q8N9_ANACO|nr:unnamed protein product [Ananas comosus var. bracteatus]
MVRSVFFILAFAIALASASSLAMGGEALEENEPSSFTGPGRFLRQPARRKSQARLLQEAMCEHDDRRPQLQILRGEVLIRASLLQRQVRCSYVRLRQLWRLQEEVQERHLLQIRDV